MENDILKLPWFTLGQPWASSDQAGTAILAGSPDPHAAIPVVDCDDLAYLWEEDWEMLEEEAKAKSRELADHIVELHNKSLAHG